MNRNAVAYALLSAALFGASTGRRNSSRATCCCWTLTDSVPCTGIPDCHDEFTGVIFTTFYYDEHEGTTDNVITVRHCADDMNSTVRHP